MARDRIFISLEHSRVHVDAQGPNGPTIFWKGQPDTLVAIRAVETANLDPNAHPQLSSLAVQLAQRLAATGLFESFAFPAAFSWKLTATLTPREEPYDYDSLQAIIQRIYQEVMQREFDISQASCSANRRWRRVTGTLTLRTLRRRRRARRHIPGSQKKINERFREGVEELLDAADSSGNTGSSPKSSSSPRGHSASNSDGCTDGCDLGCGDGCDGCGGCD